jgi:hypothetical protein
MKSILRRLRAAFRLMVRDTGHGRLAHLAAFPVDSSGIRRGALIIGASLAFATPAFAQSSVVTTTRCGYVEDMCRADSGEVCILSGQPQRAYRCETTRVVVPQPAPEMAKARR